MHFCVKCIFRNSLLACLYIFWLFCFPSFAQEANKNLPNTAQFMSMLTACAAGSRSEFKGDLIGSIRSLYEGQSTRGFAEMKTEAQFLNLLPPDKKLEGYRLYVECIKSIMNDPSASKAKVQFSLLESYTADTPFEKVIEVFGQPVQRKELYQKGKRIVFERSPVSLYRFSGVNVNFFVASNLKGKALGVGVFSEKERTKARIPYLNLGTRIGQIDRKFSTLDDFKLDYMQQLCQADELEMHARFQYIMTPICYFGAPGGYVSYQFIFQPLDADGKCSDNFDWQRFSQIKCRSVREVKPNLVFVYFVDDLLPDDMANAVMEWMYNFAQ